jgi:F-type H+-transporting ATPase subunit alpha
MEQEVIVFWSIANGYLDEVDIENIGKYEKELLDYIETSHPDIYKELVTEQKLEDKLEAKIKKAVESFTKRFISKQK